MQTINIRGIKPEIKQSLKSYAQQERVSVNTQVLRLIEQGIKNRITDSNHSISNELSTKNDALLMDLAGVWQIDEALDFETNTADFRKIDITKWK